MPATSAAPAGRWVAALFSVPAPARRAAPWIPALETVASVARDPAPASRAETCSVSAAETARVPLPARSALAAWRRAELVASAPAPLKRADPELEWLAAEQPMPANRRALK